MPSTPFAYDSAHTHMSCCRCTQPFGPPVLPDEYSQNAMASLCVGSASRTGDDSASSARNRGSRRGGSPTTMTCARRGNSARSIAWNSLEQRVADHERTRAAVAEGVLVVPGPPHGVERDRHEARLDGAEERVGERRSVLQDQRDALLGLDAKAPQCGAEPVDALGDLRDR